MVRSTLHSVKFHVIKTRGILKSEVAWDKDCVWSMQSSVCTKPSGLETERPDQMYSDSKESALAR